MTKLGSIEIIRRTGKEMFHDSKKNLGFDMLSFWQWSTSDIVSNATRGVLAEYLVAQALGVANGNVREEWAAYDLTSFDGTRIEVKSAAFIQSWRQDKLSKISFNVPKTLAWNKESNRQSREAKRQADVYVFALLAHTDQSTLDPMDLSQWEFYVLPTIKLDRRTRSQHSITLPSLRSLANALPFTELNEAIKKAAIVQNKEISEAAIEIK